MCSTGGLDWGVIVGAGATLLGTFLGARWNSSAQNKTQAQRNEIVKGALIPIMDTVLELRSASIDWEIRHAHLDSVLNNGNSLIMTSDDKDLAAEFYKTTGIIRNYFAIRKDPHELRIEVNKFKEKLGWKALD